MIIEGSLDILDIKQWPLHADANTPLILYPLLSRKIFYFCITDIKMVEHLC